MKKTKTYLTKTVFGSKAPDTEIHFNSTKFLKIPAECAHPNFCHIWKAKTSRAIRAFCSLHLRHKHLSGLLDYFRSDRKSVDSSFKSCICQELSCYKTPARTWRSWRFYSLFIWPVLLLEVLKPNCFPYRVWYFFKLNSGKTETQTPKALQLQTTGSLYPTVAVI